MTEYKELIKWSKLDPWKQELAKLVMQAHQENKLLRTKYGNYRFTPKGLAAELIKGHFIWELVNWELIPREGSNIDFPDPPEEI